jgi:hypothetical protein
MLVFDKAWRFDSPGELPQDAVNAIDDLVSRIVAQGQSRQGLLEHFKRHFARAGGYTTSWSSSESWSQSDLDSAMRHAANSAPLFIEAFYDACAELNQTEPTIALPDLARINRALFESDAGYEIQPPNLVATNGQAPICAPEPVASFTQQAQDRIQTSLAESDRLLAEGRDRQAVQEVLWLLESIATVFQGLEIETGTVQGKYFNKIAEDLKRHHKGKQLEQVLTWTMQLHGYLSSPTGGGVRHGADLRAEITILPHEARLYCNLIRSYIYFLMSEHDRLSGMK